MTDKRIEPALSPEEWAKVAEWIEERPRWLKDREWELEDWSDHAKIALANAALPDSDPRKITREKVEALRAWVPSLNNHSGFRELAVLLHHHANALSSYLPPEDGR